MIGIDPTSSFWMGSEVIGVDWGGTRIRAGLVRFSKGNHEILSLVDRRWDRSGYEDRDLHFLAALLEESFPSDLPVGLALAAMLDSRSGRLWNAPNLGWDIPAEGQDFGALAHRILRRPVAVLNDVSAATFAEFHLGVGGRLGHLLGVFLGTGLGAGFVADGRLLEGARGVALELGHLMVQPGGRLCGCGRRGCLEAYVGGRHLLERLHRDAEPGGALRESLVWSLAGGRLEALHPGLVDQACGHGDDYACRFWDEVSDYLGTALAHVVTLLDPGMVVLGGSVFLGCPNLVARSIEAAKKRANAPALVDLEFVVSRLGDHAGMLGAALGATEARVR